MDLKPPKPLSLAEHTLYAELIERSLDAMFDEQFAENGSFVTRRQTNREGVARNYFYYIGYRPGGEGPAKDKRYSQYAGPVDDPALAERVERFRHIKEARRETASIVTALIGAGMPRPPVTMGRIIEALAKAGLFRMRAVLIGTAAYQTYPALTGFRQARASVQTGDVDIAQFRSISVSIEDQTRPILDILRAIDPSFAPVPPIADEVASVSFRNSARFRLDILTPHRGSDDQMGRPLRMPALAGAAAEPFRFLDFLIHKPVRSVVLHGPGIAVTVPAPERFAIHKMIVSQRRQSADPVSQAKARKDLAQAAEIIAILTAAGRAEAVSGVLAEALNRGPTWRTLIAQANEALPADVRLDL